MAGDAADDLQGRPGLEGEGDPGNAEAIEVEHGGAAEASLAAETRARAA